MCNILMRPIKKNDQIQKEIKNMKILILDDDQSRHVLFKRNLIGHITGYAVAKWLSASANNMAGLLPEAMICPGAWTKIDSRLTKALTF